MPLRSLHKPTLGAIAALFAVGPIHQAAAFSPISVSDDIPPGAIDITDGFFGDDETDTDGLLTDISTGLQVATQVSSTNLVFNPAPVTTEVVEEEAYFLADQAGPMTSVSTLPDGISAARAGSGDLGVFASTTPATDEFNLNSASSLAGYFDFVSADSASASGLASLELSFGLTGTIEAPTGGATPSAGGLTIAAGTTEDVVIGSNFDSVDTGGLFTDSLNTQLLNTETDELFGSAIIHNINTVDVDGDDILSGIFTIDETITFSIPVTLGQGQGIVFGLGAFSFNGAEVDFFSSLVLSSVALTQNGQAIDDAVVFGDLGGTLLDLTDTEVPIPAAFWLFGAGAVLLARRRLAKLQ